MSELGESWTDENGDVRYFGCTPDGVRVPGIPEKRQYLDWLETLSPTDYSGGTEEQRIQSWRRVQDLLRANGRQT